MNIITLMLLGFAAISVSCAVYSVFKLFQLTSNRKCDHPSRPKQMKVIEVYPIHEINEYDLKFIEQKLKCRCKDCGEITILLERITIRDGKFERRILNMNHEVKYISVCDYEQ